MLSCLGCCLQPENWPWICWNMGKTFAKIQKEVATDRNLKTVVTVLFWLLVWNLVCFHVLGKIIPTDSFFQRGWNHRPLFFSVKIVMATLVKNWKRDQESWPLNLRMCQHTALQSAKTRTRQQELWVISLPEWYNIQWEFQDPKIEVRYHIRRYFVGTSLKFRLYIWSIPPLNRFLSHGHWNMDVFRASRCHGSDPQASFPAIPGTFHCVSWVCWCASYLGHPGVPEGWIRHHTQQRVTLKGNGPTIAFFCASQMSCLHKAPEV